MDDEQADSNSHEFTGIKTSDQAEREVDDLLARMSSEYYAEVDSNIISAAMRKELLVWHNTALAQARREGEVAGRIDELENALVKYSRTYKQTVTDPSGNVYIDDSHGYISRYEVQERLAALQSAHEGKGKDE